jgi:hypothetical protein
LSIPFGVVRSGFRMAYIVKGEAGAYGKQVTISEETRIGALKIAVDVR